MFVPFVFEMSTYEKAELLWVFCKALDFSKRTHAAVIAKEVYCNTPLSSFQEEGRWEILDQIFIESALLYQHPKDEDRLSQRIYSIPNALLEPIVQKQGSISDAYSYLLTQVDRNLSNFLGNLMEKIESDCGERIEGFISFGGSIPSLDVEARARGIPVIHWEMGCWRYPVYLNTAYWDLNDLFGGTSIEERWKRFCEERKKEEIPLLSKQECLALLLRKEKLYLVDEYGREPIKKVGVALGFTDPELVSSKTKMNDSELLYRVKRIYGLENMLIRKHPGNPCGAQYPIYAKAMEQAGRSTPEFILDCETVVSLMSGAEMEAMLYNRKAITLLPCPAYFASGHILEGEGRCAGEDFISFFAFCYLIPLEYMMDPDYFRWRLTMPTEREIYFKHLEFYFWKKGLPKDLIKKGCGERLDMMLKLQSYQCKVITLEQDLAASKKINDELTQLIAEKKREILEIQHSKSYNVGRAITWLPRKIRDGLNRLKI